MDGRERVLRTLEFRGPDRIPRDVWVLPAARIAYGKQLEELGISEQTDLVSLTGALDPAATPGYFEEGVFVDPWGCTWNNIQAGLMGEVKKPVFEEYDGIGRYQAPIAQFLKEWEAGLPGLQAQIADARKHGKFIVGGWISLFERMQYLRGTENLYCDIALEEDGLFQLAELVMGYQRIYTEKWLELDIDAMAFGDDWGSQISLLISPDQWRKIFKPLYRELIGTMKAAGKKVFFHSDGYIMSLYPEFIELGVDAINSQLWCMGVEEVAEKYAGKITFWGEISRQTTLPKGTPKEVREAASIMKEHMFLNGGGLIGQSEINKDVPLENIRALLNAWA